MLCCIFELNLCTDASTGNDLLRVMATSVTLRERRGRREGTQRGKKALWLRQAYHQLSSRFSNCQSHAQLKASWKQHFFLVQLVFQILVISGCPGYQNSIARKGFGQFLNLEFMKLQYTLSFQSLNPPKLIKLTKGSEFLLRSAVMQKKCVNYVSELLLKVLEESKCLKIPYSSRREGCCSGLILLLIYLFLWNAFLFVFKGEK